MAEMQANTPGMEAGATPSAGDNATAELVKWKTIAQDGTEKEVSASLEDLKAAWDKKLTNQDKFFQKKSMEQSRAISDAEKAKQDYASAVEQMNKLYGNMSLKGQQSMDNINSGDYSDQDINVVLKQLDQFVSKKVADVIGDKLKNVEQLEAGYKEQKLMQRAATIEKQVSAKLEKVGLADEDKQEFIYRFMGKHNVSNMPTEDGYDSAGNYREGFYSTFDKELASWTKMMKEKGLLSAKSYVDGKEEKNKRFSTDARGVRGAELKAPAKTASMREHREYKKQVMTNLANKYFKSERG